MEILQNPPCFAAVNEEREGSRRLVRRRRALVLRGEEDGRPRVVRSRRLESTACGSGCARARQRFRARNSHICLSPAIFAAILAQIRLRPFSSPDFAARLPHDVQPGVEEEGRVASEEQSEGRATSRGGRGGGGSSHKDGGGKGRGCCE